ncbi:MoxR-like ATPase [Sediminitomix flava]|uniref:MoxR-like ATPase n=2 Tax=Sediminitomix flava TaxID=379075 RepID=A0A315ZG25_SEDFL|nr:MoxR-like ATPase [Sediminitomix flava]
MSVGLYEREEVIALAFLSAIAGESIFMLGPPGVAKSMVARRLKHAFKDGKSFEYLMNRFSTPDEIFGPVSIHKLSKEDKFERLTDHYLPGASVVFLDEIWKAGPSIQNALLTVINEKLYRNGEQEVKVKLQGLLAASNELPARGEGLEALWDRFLLRYYVYGIQEDDHFFDMITSTIPEDIELDQNLQISVEELAHWDALIDEIEVPKEVRKVISVIRKYIKSYNTESQQKANHDDIIYVSDRRWRKIIRLIRTSAFLNGRKEVDLMDCFVMMHCIWNNPVQMDLVARWVGEAIQKYGFSTKFSLDALKNKIDEFQEEVEEETKEAKTLNAYLPELFDERYYRISNFDSSFDRILKEDFEILSGAITTMSLYNASSQSQKYSISKLAADEVEVSINNTYRRFKLKSSQQQRTGFVIRKISQEKVAEFDQEANQILNYLNEVAEQIADYRASEKVVGSLFLNEQTQNLFHDSLNETLRVVLERKLKIEKVKSSYRS